MQGRASIPIALLAAAAACDEAAPARRDTKRGSAADSSGDLDGDGHTDLEEYLNGSDPTAPGC